MSMPLVFRPAFSHLQGFAFILPVRSYRHGRIVKEESEPMSNETRGLQYGVAGVAIFSLTLPFTRIAVTELDPVFVAMARAVVAGFCSVWLLWRLRAPWPTPSQLKALAIVAAGVVFGFPVLTSIAMHEVPAAHGAIVLGILPLATALFGALRFGERPSAGFWITALVGSALVTGFALTDHPGGSVTLVSADAALFGAVIAAAMGYAEGARLSESMGGQQVISWALLLSMPVLIVASLWLGWRHGVSASPRVWAAFAYLSLFSMFIGFFFWYKGLALGGIARVGQTQLLQPFMTLAGAAILAGEPFTLKNVLFAFAVIGVVAIGRKMPVRR
jgi:drug/metabolite transporter (DMT)-like permease